MAELERLDRLQRLREVLAKSRDGMVDARRQLGQLSARAESRDGSVVVVLDSSGQLSQLELRGDVHRDLEGYELCQRIMEVAREAQEQLRRSVVELMPRSPWGGLTIEEMLDPNTDLDRMLPQGLFDLAGMPGTLQPPGAPADPNGGATSASRMTRGARRG